MTGDGSRAVRPAGVPRSPRTRRQDLGREGHRRRPEPPFIPRLQSRFADFPWGRSLLARSCVLRRPDAVIGTARGRVHGPALRGPRDARVRGAGLCEPGRWVGRRALRHRRASQDGTRVRPRASGTGGRCVRRRGDRACRSLGRLACRVVAEARRLGPSDPRRSAESCSSSAGVCLVATPIKIWTTVRSTSLHSEASTRAAPRPTCFDEAAACGDRAAARSIFRARRFGR